MEELDALYTEFFEESGKVVTEIDGARIFLDYCVNTGRQIFLLSAIKDAHFETQSRELGLRKYFDYAYTDVRDKTQRIHSILSEHNIDCGEALFAGDMQHDVEAANCADLLSVATLTGYNNREQLNAASPDLIVDDLSFLTRCI